MHWLWQTSKSVLEKVNKQLCVGNDVEMFVTVWLGILEILTGKLICSNASDVLYGTDQMRDTLNRNKECDCEQLLSTIKEDVDAFVGQAPPFLQRNEKWGARTVYGEKVYGFCGV